MNFCLTIPYRRHTFQVCLVEKTGKGTLKTDPTRAAKSQALFNQIETERARAQDRYFLQ